MYSDNKLILQLVSLLKQYEIKRIVISPGSRHYPLIRSLEVDSFFELFSVVDERSAAFFALGLIQNSQEPVAVCCTSGTSTINYGSAVVEAFYQKLPLLLLTADRLPEYLGQMEEQMYKQDDTFHHFIKFHGQLKPINNSLDEWYCNRIINEGLLALSYRGFGPVHLNFPIESHHSDSFSTSLLPKARKIGIVGQYSSRHVWNSIAEKVNGKKVLIVCGQTFRVPPDFISFFDSFVKQHHAVVLCDHLNNFKLENSFSDTYLIVRSIKKIDIKDYCPDIVITLFSNTVFNGEFKSFLKNFPGEFEHWHIDQSGKIIDPFQSLTTIFDVSEDVFFEKISSVCGTSNQDYYSKWLQLSSSIDEPKVGFSELRAIGDFLKVLPNNSLLHVANSLPIRMLSTFSIADNIKVYCNRGVNGIDGCMSTAVGYAALTTEPVYLIIGDLTFFYDMNALWNRHLSKNFRILLLNNEGGGVMHMPLPASLSSDLSRYVSAGHGTSAEGWVKSLGMDYLAVKNESELARGLQWLVENNTDGSKIVEVFTEKAEDVKILKSYFKSLDRESILDKVFRKARGKISQIINK